MQNTIDYIRDNMTEAEKWGQLAEEAAELSQAALKMQRLAMPLNKPRLSQEACIAKLDEEAADVMLCLQVLGYSRNPSIEAYKANRWANGIADKLREAEA